MCMIPKPAAVRWPHLLELRMFRESPGDDPPDRVRETIRRVAVRIGEHDGCQIFAVSLPVDREAELPDFGPAGRILDPSLFEPVRHFLAYLFEETKECQALSCPVDQ